MWIYLPSTCSRSAPASDALTLRFEWLCHMLEPSATWKGKLLPRKSWLRVLRKTTPSTRRLFGRTYGPSMAAHGVALWIASVAGTRASRSRERASSAGREIRGISGRTSRASSQRSNRRLSSLKTSTHTSALDSARSPKSYEVWATRAKQESLVRRKSAHRILENAYSSWPTARAEDSESCGNHAGSTDSLTGAAKNWKTPHGFQNTDRNGKTAGGGGDGEFAKQAMSWQTPATDSFRSRGGERKDEPGLDRQARNWKTPRSLTGGPESAQRKQELGRVESGGGDLQAQGRELADAEHAPISARPQVHQIGRPLQTARFDDGSRAVANAAGQGLPERRYRRDRQHQSTTVVRGSLPAFPPGPEDLDAWRELLAADPSLEPALCGPSDGSTARVDELRALGNSVVPLVAAYAFLALADA